MEIDDYLYAKYVAKPLSIKKEKMSEETWNKLDRNVLGEIRLHLSENFSHNVAKETTNMGASKDVIQILDEKIRKGKSSVDVSDVAFNVLEISKKNNHRSKTDKIIHTNN
ncbi:hypothetical protein LIER_40326 [Lithospermum erythrorhizon]|uniref:Uncharacterized protein n=1 Tax=Lithospermum erythrorhizon TaxID=34254 RepID=A0AAV3QQ80_LITER